MRTLIADNAGTRNDSTAAPVLSVVVPTRNEAANVEPLMRRLDAALGAMPYEVIFVDDSDDGTPEAVQALIAGDYPQVGIVHRPQGARPNGLSGAVLEGFRTARGDYVAVIDADLQHPPELLPRLIAYAVSQNEDLVIASRYVQGGSALGLGSVTRRLVSRATSLFARTLFHEHMWRVHDPGSGFFVLRRSLLEGVTLRPIGYKILLEVLLRSRWTTMAEIPYSFRDREAGVSKADVRQGIHFLKHCGRLFVEVPSAGRVWKLGLFVGAFAIGRRVFKRR